VLKPNCDAYSTISKTITVILRAKPLTEFAKGIRHHVRPGYAIPEDIFCSAFELEDIACM